jgi:hypothetical protein
VVKARSWLVAVGVLVVCVIAFAGCGSSSSSTGLTANETTTGGTEPEAGKGGGETAPAGKAPTEAESLATGDIPDNQVFLTFKNPQAGYVIRYPEGWARKGGGNAVTFREKANIVQIAVKKGAPPKSEGKKTSFTRRSAPDPVTGKSVTLMVDRYEFGHGGKLATLELSTPEGVDNVDAYRMISESFKWLP